MEVVVSVIDLFRRQPAEPNDLEDEAAQDTNLDLPIFMRDTGEWPSGLRRVYAKPLEWSAGLPTRPGFYLIRPPGAERPSWKVVDVWRGAHGLRAGWTDIEYRSLTDLADWEFCPIREPRP